MRFNSADVAELVDARDLKFSGADENTQVSRKTSSGDPAEIATAPSHLQNAERRTRPPGQYVVVDKDGKIFASFPDWKPAHDWARANMPGEQDSSGDYEDPNGWDVRTAGCE